MLFSPSGSASRVDADRYEKRNTQPFDLLYLAIVFAVIIVMLNLKPTIEEKSGRCRCRCHRPARWPPFSFRISPTRVGQLAFHTVFNWHETLSLCLVTYLITFLQRMMQQKNHLNQAQEALSAIFNSRRVNATVAPMLTSASFALSARRSSPVIW